MDANFIKKMAADGRAAIAERKEKEEKSEKQLQKEAKEGIKESVEKAEEARNLEEIITESLQNENETLRLKKLYEKHKDKWTNEFTEYSAKCEKSLLDNDINELLNTFIQIHDRMNEVKNDENLSSKGKESGLKDLNDLLESKIGELNNCRMRINALDDGLELEIARSEGISESEFAMLPGDRNEKADYSIYCELKQNRLFNEFKFSAVGQRDGKTTIDYRWLLRLYQKGKAASDKMVMYFVEQVMDTARDNPLDYYSRDGRSQEARGTLEKHISEARSSRVPKELLELERQLRFLRDKTKHLRELSRSDSKDRKFHYMKRYWQ